MEQEDTHASLYLKMSRAMGILSRIPKRGYHAHFKYHYILDADVMDAVRTAMAEVGIAFFVTTIDIEQQGHRTIGTYKATFADSETGETVSVIWIGEAIDQQDKGMNKALTAAIKYGLMKTFLISSGENDPDTSIDQAKTPKLAQAKTESDGQISPVPSDQWNDLPIPQDFTELYSRVGQLGYTHRNHAANVIKQLDKPSITEAWMELITHQQSKLADANAETAPPAKEEEIPF